MVIHPSVGWMIVIACATLLISWTVYWDYHKKRLQFEKRRVAIENGIEPPPPPVPQLAGWPGVKQVEMQLKYAERRLMIEKGLQLDECVPKPKPPLTRQDYLRRGILMTCLGVGLLLGYVLLNYVRVDGRVEAQAWCLGL